MTDRMFIYCDHPSHAPKRVPVTAFLKLPDDGWHEQPHKRKQGRAGHVGTGMHMLDDSPAGTGWANEDVSNVSIRTRYELFCEQTPACRKRPVPARQDHLFRVLDRWRDLGADELALAVLAANLGEQAERRSLD